MPYAALNNKSAYKVLTREILDLGDLEPFRSPAYVLVPEER